MPLHGCINYSDFLKPATATKTISAPSGKRAMTAAIAAAGKTGWTPKVISLETNYMLAEQEPDVVGRSARSYAFSLEVRLPERGRGRVTVTVVPPQGITSDTPTQVYADAFVQALARELGHGK
ncbi:hypothetical protein [Thiocystis violacea]|uniref:hypothetical protein n=1 Tax=Thiocystis violacea TaxID=13725 RepID=UPI001907C920|nr:hypothetical protein [Thiocystis violacea]